MSRASEAVTPTSGMAVRGSTVVGSSIQRTRFPGEFGSTPAIYIRPANPPKGGPTFATAPLTPGTVWQAPQP